MLSLSERSQIVLGFQQQEDKNPFLTRKVPLSYKEWDRKWYRCRCIATSTSLNTVMLSHGILVGWLLLLLLLLLLLIDRSIVENSIFLGRRKIGG